MTGAITLLELQPMPDDNGGYVRVYRSILDNPTFQNGEEAMFFAYLVLKANWKPGERRYDDRVYRLDRGEMVIGMRKLAEEFGWSHKRVRNIFRRLIAGNMVVLSWAQHGAQRAPVTTICNYGEFQAPIGERAQGGAQAGAQGGHKGGTPKKEGKEGNKDNTVDLTADEPFKVFWRAYPSRRSHSNPRKPARAKFEAALKRGAAAADIIRGAERYAAYVEREHTDPKYVAQAQTWLNQERWTQDQQEAATEPTPIML